MVRLREETLQEAERLQVVSSPVDTFVRPSTSGGRVQADQLKQLASSLSGFNSSLSKYANNAYERKSEAELKAGQEARLKNAVDFKEAVDKGLIDKTQSPWFMKGYAVQSGKADAHKYNLDLQKAYASSPIQGTKDTEAVTQFFQSFRESWLSSKDTNNSDYLDGLSPMMLQAENNIKSAHAAKVASDIKSENLENLSTEHLFTIENAIDAETPFDVIAEQLTNANETQLFVGGFTNSEINDITLDNIVTLAIERKDPKILELTDHIKAGKHSLSDRPKVRDALENARTTIASRTAAEMRQANYITDTIRDNKRRDITNRALESLISDPSADLSNFIDEASDSNVPEVVSTLNTLKGTMASLGEVSTNPSTFKELAVGLSGRSKSADDVLDAYVAGELEFEDYKRLDAMASDVENKNSPLNDTEFQRFSRDLQRTLVGDQFTFDKQAEQVEAMETIYRFQEEYLEFLDKDKNGKTREAPVSPSEKIDFLQEKTRLYQWKTITEGSNPDSSTIIRLINKGAKPPEGFDVNSLIPKLGNDLFLLSPDKYDPAKQAMFENMEALKAAVSEYNKATQSSEDAARKTFIGQMAIHKGVSPQDFLRSQKALLQ